MKQALLLCAAMTLCATTAFASGVDLSVGACPSNPGVSDHATLECAAGQTLSLLVTFMPNEAIADLAGIDMILDVYLEGDLDAANFWNFGYSSTAAGSNHARPADGCSNYLDTWSATGSGSQLAFVRRTPSIMRIGAVSYTPTPVAVAMNQRLFGMQLTIDASTSLESGSGTFTGCMRHATIIVLQLEPGSASGQPTTNLISGSVFTTEVVLNPDAVPTLRHSWGRLKSLYR